jgi:hypothetical protein
MKFKKMTICLFLSLSLYGTLHAEQHRQEGVHEHGVARLNLAQEGKRIELHLESPATNLVGYEHMPSSDADRQVLEETLAKLRAADQIFRFDEQAKCRLIDAEVSTPLTGEEGSMSTQHDTHEEAAHEEDHEHEHERHADVDADYRFECAEPDKLSRIRMDLFRHFPATHELHVQFATDKRQGSVELTADDAELEL